MHGDSGMLSGADAATEGRLVSDEEIEEKERQRRAIESQKSQQHQLASVLQEGGSGWKVVGCARNDLVR
jgi:hypothetical protein